MKSSKKKSKRKQSNLSRALASSNRTSIVHKNFFSLSAHEIRRNTPKLAHHRHFEDALHPNGKGAVGIYTRQTIFLPLEKCISWCLGLLEIHAAEIHSFLKTQEELLESILLQKYEFALSTIQSHDDNFGISAWSVSLQGILRSIISPESQREYLGKLISEADDNGFFKALAFNLTKRFDDPETLQSESRFFELKIKRTFSGKLLHFLMYKLVPLNIEFEYDFESILDTEKDSSPVDIFICLIDFLTYNLHSKDQAHLAICRNTILDLRRNFNNHVLDNLAIAFGLIQPEKISTTAIEIIDTYTSGNYGGVYEKMKQDAKLVKHFGLIEILAKSLARTNKQDEALLPNLLPSLVDVITKSADYEKSRAELLAYCHAFSMLMWFRELRYLLERETRFYDLETNEKLRQSSLLLSSLSTPAKIEELAKRGAIPYERIEELTPQHSVTARLFNRMRAPSDTEPSSDELDGIEKSRKLKFRAAWNLSRYKFQDAIPILEELLQSSDTRASQDASRSLVEAYRATGEIEKAADVYVEALLENVHLLSAFDSAGLSKACSTIIKSSQSISIPIALSLHSRFVGDTYDAALKYSFECFLRNNNLESPLELLTTEALQSVEVIYFLRHICTPEVMKLYLYFETPKEIEQCRIEICKALINLHEADEELLFEIKDRTRRLVLREAVNQVQGGRIFSDANLLTGPSSGAFKTLYERFSALRQQDFSAWEDELALQGFVDLMKRDKLLFEHAHAIHVQDLVLNEKNSVFLKLIKLVRDEFAFGEKGLNLYLSTRIRHGHFPTTIRKPLLDNTLLASKATDTSGYKLGKEWKSTLHPSRQAEEALESAIIDFSVKFNDLVDKVNDNWLRIFTIDQDISGLSKEGELKESLFNYSVSAIEAYYLQSELNSKSSFTEFITTATKWLWVRTEQNLANIRGQLADEMSGQALSMLEDLGKAVIPKYGVEGLGDFPDALVRARNGLNQAFETLQGWFTRAQGANIKSFELEIPVQIASMAIDVDIEFNDESDFSWNGSVLSPIVDGLFILFENAVSKSGLPKSEIQLCAKASKTEDSLIISVQNRCAPRDDLATSNSALDRYRDPRGYQSAVNAAQAEGGSGFFKLWHLLEKDMNLIHEVKLGFATIDSFEVQIIISLSECQKVCSDEDTIDRR